MITVVIPFCAADYEAALRLIDWIAELGGAKGNDCMLVAPPSLRTGVPIAKAQEAFKSVELIPQAITLPDESHPIGPNLMFESALKHMHRTNAPNPWLWLEPDAVPMRKNWLQDIESEYSIALTQGKTILAQVARLNDPRFPLEIPSGIAVYPSQAWFLYRRLQTNRKVAWDIQFARHVMPMVYESEMIHNIVNHKNPPTFIPKRMPNMARGQMALTDVASTKAIFHPSKDGTLIDLLRKAKQPAFQMPRLVPHDPLGPDFLDIPHDGSDWRIEDYMATVPLISVPRNAPPVPKRTNRIIHCVQRWRPHNESIDRRIRVAMLGWIKVYESREVIPCHVWEPFRRDATILGDERKLPFLKDILEAGMAKCENVDDIVLLTNDDSVPHPDIHTMIFRALETRPCVCTGRLNYKHPAMPDFTDRNWPTEIADIGRDAFAFRLDWLKEHFDEIPDMLLSEVQFDIVLGTMIRVANGVKPTLASRTKAIPEAELPYGVIQHEDHPRGWTCGPTPGQAHNLKLAAEWYRANKLQHMVDFV